MSAADDRQTAIEKKAEAIRNVYRMNGVSETVTLFAEDYDFLIRRENISKAGYLFENGIQVRRGQRKKKVSRRRPKESMF